jgi:nitroimidazol reductase NimA-like FMN-containing flavoprotein (pyridoxamine 5'-phosphate oxidase superfamily)
MRTSHSSDDPIETLSDDECQRYLREGGVACLGLSATALRPVNFVLDEKALVLRTGEGRILDAARGRQGAGLMLHGIDKLEHTGWSVVVRGVLVERPTDDRHLALPLRPWASGKKDRFVALLAHEISGRRIPPGRGNR